MKIMKFSVIFLYFLVHDGLGKRVKDKIYVNIDNANNAPCFRRLNGTHQIGCTSEPKGNVGVVHFINDSSDLSWVLQTGPNHPYAVLLKAKDFNVTILKQFKNSGRVNGVMVIHVLDANVTDDDDTFATPEQFSPDKSCPNDEYGLYADNPDYSHCKQTKWNPYGDDMMFQEYNFPIVILTDKENVTFVIENCYKKFNQPLNGVSRDFPLCAVQLKDRMDGATNSEVCIRRTRHQLNITPDRYCDPLGDQNVYATVKTMNSTEHRPNNSVIVIAARMDSFSMFEEIYPSADNHVSGIVALLAVAEAIGKVKDKIRNSPNDVLFTFFQGEAWDYIGSGRMVYEMGRNNFPETHGTHLSTINLTSIAKIVEVNQLAYRDNGKVWIHTDPVTRPNVSKEVDEMIRLLKELDSSLIDAVQSNRSLPPASVQSFLKKQSIPAVVITDHENAYTNKYYNSRFDLARAIKVDYGKLNKTDWYDHVTEQAKNLTEVATLLARYIYRLATNDNETGDIIADNKTVTHLLYCYLISPNCEIFKESLDSDKASKLAKKPYQFYVGVNYQINQYTALTEKVLQYFLGDKVNATKDNCNSKYKPDQTVLHYSWMLGPKDENGTRHPFCMSGTANMSAASSLAFETDNYDYTSREFSTWTESSWQVDAISVRFFLLPGKSLETTTLALGVIILLTSMLGTWLIGSKVDHLFAPSKFNRFRHDKILDQSKFKEVADENFMLMKSLR